MHDGAESDDADVAAFFDYAGFAERNGIVGPGIFGTIVGLAVKMLVLEKHYGIVPAHGGPQEAGNIKRGGGHDPAQSSALRENGFAALAMINAAAAKIPAARSAQHRGTFQPAL